MKKFRIILPIFTLFISFGLFASTISPSIIINGLLPVQEDVFLIKYSPNSSLLNLDSGYVNIEENTDFVSNTETQDFNIYVGNYTAYDEIHRLKFYSTGFKKIVPGSSTNSNSFNFISSVSLPNKIYIRFENNNIFELGMSLTAGSSVKYLIKDNIIVNDLAVKPAASYVEANSPAYTFRFYWESETDTGIKVPAGDYVAQINVEYISIN